MDKENEKGSKCSTGESHAMSEHRNGDSDHSRTGSGESHQEEMGSTRSESLSRSSSLSSSSFSSASSSFTGLQDLDCCSKDSNSRSDERDKSPKDTPPVQVMNKNYPDGYDPKRIPASVTERSKSTIPAEWSCASNESLFSIHLGITSFSVYGDIMKSGELFRSGELVSNTPAVPMAPPPTKTESTQRTADSDKEAVEPPKEVEEESQQKAADQHTVSWRSPTTSYHSDKSSNSANSFSFPILAEGDAMGSADAEAEDLTKQKAQATKEATPNDAGTRWLCCFPPRIWCCSFRACCICSCS